MSNVDVICLNNFVSSANSNRSDVTIDGRSLINIKKSKGPRILPCGTPEITSKVPDRWLPTETHWVLLCR